VTRRCTPAGVLSRASRVSTLRRVAIDRRTKIVATLGPSSDSRERLRALIEAGVDAVRFNLSHGTHEEHSERAWLVREIAAEVGRPIALIGDLQGPKLRIGELAEPVVLHKGDKIRVCAEEAATDGELLAQSKLAIVNGRVVDPARDFAFEVPGGTPHVDASDLHLYPARPYIVSRSLVEAMAAGCVVLAADHEPVREFLSHWHTGLLTPADAQEGSERQALAVLDNPAAYRPLGEAGVSMIRFTRARPRPVPFALVGWKGSTPYCRCPLRP